VRRSVAQRVRDAIGLPAKEIVLVQPGSLQVQRFRCHTTGVGQPIIT
jgi:hypothetical protein